MWSRQRFIEGPYLDSNATTVTPATIRRLLDSEVPVVIVGTLWPEYDNELRAADHEPEGRSDHRPRYPQAVDLLTTSGITTMTVKTFSPAERAAAEQLAAGDPRLREAVAVPDCNVTEALGGVPELLRRYEHGTEPQQAVIHAAVDAHRLGIRSALTPDLLYAAARGYLTRVHPDNAWFTEALTELTSNSRRQDRATSPLISIPNPDHTTLVGYTVTDYLLQHLTRQRRTTHLTHTTWQALTTHTHNPDDLQRLAESAENRLLYQYAKPLYQHLANNGHEQASWQLDRMLEHQGRVDELAAQADNDDTSAAYRLADVLAYQGRVDELTTRADAIDQHAAHRLADILACQGRVDELRSATNAGTTSLAGRRFIDVLASQGETEVADRIRRWGLNADGSVPETDPLGGRQSTTATAF